MIDCATHEPLPDYYGGILWSQLMGTGVLSAAVSQGPPTLRAYAHCATQGAAGATVLLLNLDGGASASVSLGQLGGSSAEREEWHLTGPLGTNATAVALNGATLAFRVDPTTGGAVLPALNGRKVARVPGQNDHVILAPASIAFVRVSDGPAADLCASVEM